MASEEIVFPNNIKILRQQIGMKAKELSQRVNMSISSISKVEKGVRKLNQKQLIDFCNILKCKLSDILIKENDSNLDKWKEDINNRIEANANSGLKIFGNGLKIIRRNKLKTIKEVAEESGLSISVYHKIESGQREITGDELNLILKVFDYKNQDDLFDEISELYKNGKINNLSKKQSLNKVVGVNLANSLYTSKIYQGSLQNFIPIIGTSTESVIKLSNNNNLLTLPKNFLNSKDIYAVLIKNNLLGSVFCNKGYLIIDPTIKPNIDDLVLAIDKHNFSISSLNHKDNIKAVVCKLCKDNDCLYGSAYGKIFKYKTFHKIIMIKFE